MIEQYESDRMCKGCGVWQPLSWFSVSGYRDDLTPIHRHTCKSCRRIYARKPNKRGGMGDRSPTAWLLPRDERPHDDRALDSVLRSWRGPVRREPMRGAA